MRFGQQTCDLFVARLVEVLIPDTHGAKRLWTLRADDSVGDLGQPIARVTRADRDSDDDRGWRLLA
jgi:hypothetical protein